MNQCTWTYSNQKAAEGWANYIARDLVFYDDFRPVYRVSRGNRRLELVPQRYKKLTTL